MRPSLVWLAPLIALAISLGIAWSSWSNRGPLVEVILDSASGLEEGKTPLKHKDVEIGTVETVGFTDGLKDVLASIRVGKEFAPYFDQSAQFWVVRPKVTTQGISGLETVLSGPYIEVAWDGEKGERKERYTALKDVPLSKPSDAGIRLRLRANDGGAMSVGAPVLYKRIEVGRIESKELSPDGERVDFNIFINAPHDRLMTSGTRFWNLSGIAVEISTEGAKLKVDSLASLLQGGVSFDNVTTDGTPVKEFQSFVLYENEAQARRSVFSDDSTSQLRLSVEFESSVRGLNIGAPVEYRGLRVGEVTDVAAKLRANEEGDNDISLIVTIVISPARLGLEENGREDSIEFLKRGVRRGLRARLKSASLLTGALFVELVEQPDAPVALLDELASPYPRLPSVPSDFDDFTASAEGVLNRINGLPIEEMMFSATELLRNLNALASAESTTAVPTNLNGVLEDVRDLLGNPELQKAPADLAATLAAARAVMEEVNKVGAAEALVTALEDASNAAKAFTAMSIGVPALITSATALSDDLNEVPITDLVVAATTLLEDADKIVAADGMADIPANLNASILSLREILEGLREVETAKTLQSVLVASREAAERVTAASANIPGMVETMTGIADTVNELPFEDLVLAATNLVESAESLVASDGLQAAPQALADTLDAARALLVDLKDAGAAENLSQALEAARDAATAFATAAEGTPQLIARFEAIAANVQGLPLDDLLASVQSLVDDANTVVASQGMQQAPQALADTLNAARALMVDLQRADTAQKLSDALVAAQGAAQSVSGAVQGVPLLSMRLTELAEKATALPIEGLLASATLVLDDADRILRAPGAEQIPGSITAALDQVRSLVIELRQSGTATNVNGALVSVAQAGQSFQTLSQNLSVLIPKLTAVAASADSVLSSVDVGSELNYEAATALREVRDAARAITALAATVERRPNSLLLGK
jgi:paraquat-inducible protein B